MARKRASQSAAPAQPRVLSTEDVLDLVECETGYRPKLQTLHRWIRVGVGGTRLRCRRVGGRLLIEPSAVHDFLRDTQSKAS